MTTLIAVYTREGCVGRCDAKCYNAWEPECDCICQGATTAPGSSRRSTTRASSPSPGSSTPGRTGRTSRAPSSAIDAMHQPLFDLGGAR